ncbi:MAG: septum formation initiator family protein [Candidatus Magasanikbacteria bacterium]|nr:septum formation initiator family protein [Candidatus Magasanikbacteria bacterium]
MGKRSLIGRITRSRFFVVALTVFLILFAIGFFRSFWRDYQIRQEIKQMEMAKQSLEEKKIKTLDLLNELEGDAAAEREARLNFGLVKPGEQVVIITEGTEKVSEKKSKNKLEETKSNLIWWWNYFFAPKTN